MAVPMRERVVKSAPLVALGARLARKGWLATASIAIGVFTTVATVAIAIGAARRGGEAPVSAVPIAASGALAWGAGFLLAFSAAAHSLRTDRADGIQHLLLARTTSLRAYIVARIVGLAALLVVVVAGGTLLTGIAAIIAAAKIGSVLKTLQATFAAVAFALAFSAVISPIAFAALGARSRVGGYLFMIFVVVAPEVFAGILEGPVPQSVTEVIAIPSALAALRSALAPGTFDFARALRACIALGFWVMIGSFLVRRAVAVIHSGEADAA